MLGPTILAPQTVCKVLEESFGYVRSHFRGTLSARLRFRWPVPPPPTHSSSFELMYLVLWMFVEKTTSLVGKEAGRVGPPWVLFNLLPPPTHRYVPWGVAAPSGPLVARVWVHGLWVMGLSPVFSPYV